MCSICTILLIVVWKLTSFLCILCINGEDLLHRLWCGNFEVRFPFHWDERDDQRKRLQSQISRDTVDEW